ncbi:hypothetical protein F4804DRAFT_339618 [Jackrogersella minutella]|nr:hypothetical protein F4804DRAFT_339618 [Jackrogersella minutella]
MSRTTNFTSSHVPRRTRGTIPTNPDPTGFKVWALAEDDYIPKMIWHISGTVVDACPQGIPKQPYNVRVTAATGDDALNISLCGPAAPSSRKV